MLILLPSAVRTTSGSLVLPSTLHPERWAAIVLLLDVTAAATAAGDTLDVYLQSAVNGEVGSPAYDDFVHFTQVLGNGGAKKFIATWIRDYTPTSALHAPADGTLAAGVSQGPVGDTWRIKWTIASASAPSFTFSLGMYPTRYLG